MLIISERDAGGRGKSCLITSPLVIIILLSEYWTQQTKKKKSKLLAFWLRRITVGWLLLSREEFDPVT